MQFTCTILSSVACPAVRYIPHFLKKHDIFKNKFIGHKMCVLIFCSNLIKRTERDKIKNINYFVMQNTRHAFTNLMKLEYF
jgi:hypothetical protein